MVSSFVKSQFNYFFLASMCHKKALNSKFNSLYESCLSLFCCGYRLSSKWSMKCDGATSNQNRKLQILIKEIFYVKYELCSPIVKERF